MQFSEKKLEKIVEMPSRTLERSSLAVTLFGRYLSHLGPIKGVRRTWSSLGPGLVTGAADDDPSGIATYSQTGAGYGFSLLWLSLYTFPLMAIVQEMCARIALVTRKGLAQNIKTNFSKRALYAIVLLLAIANIMNIGADLGAMAAGARLIVPQISQTFFVFFFGITIILLEVYVTYKTYAKYLKWLALVTLSYVAAAILANMPWKDLVKNTFLPALAFSKQSLIMITAILGTTISPYLFFWQTSQEVEEEDKGAVVPPDRSQMRQMRIDVWVGMLLSNVVMFAIIAVCGSVLYSHGITNIATADQAALALRPFAGDFSFALFALGIIGTGMLAIPILAGSFSYALAETFGWEEGLGRKLKSARAFYGAIIFSILIGLMLNFVGLDPIKALIASAVTNGLIAPIMLVFILKVSASKKIMGENSNSKIVNFFGVIAIILMSLSALGTIFSLFG